MRRYLSIFIIGLLVLIAVLFNILVFQYRGEIASLQKKAVDLNSALALVNEQLSNESYLASEQATEIASLYQSAAELESDKENLQGKFDALNLTSIKLQDDLKAQLRESSNLRKVGLCSNINLSIEINYKSNSTVSESLKKFVGDRRGNVTSETWDVIWSDAKASTHRITTNGDNGLVDDVFIVYFDDFRGPGIYWVNETCYLDLPAE